MQENTNKAIAINSLIMYMRMGLKTIIVLFTTRFALQALGCVDYGLFSVLGSIITFMGVFNTIMISTCNRFLAVAIGKGNADEINKVFNINLAIFLGCAIGLLIIMLPIGTWYVVHHINYDGPIKNALVVFYFAIIGSIASTIATPYNGLIMAKERFLLFCSVDVIMNLINLVVAILIVYFFLYKLYIYTFFNSITITIPALIYYLYCRHHFPELVKFRIIKDINSYKKVFSFSGWVSYGAVACIIKNQGATLLINSFFTTAMNTALGVATNLSQCVITFANNLTQPMQPQITKSYAAGNFKRTDELLTMSTKFSFLLMLLVSVPLIIETEWILKLWLGDVPPYAVSFTILLIIDNLVTSFNSGLSLVIFADGRIALYQFVINTLRLLSIVVAYIALRFLSIPQALFYVYIAFSVLIVFSTQWCLYKTLNYDISTLFKESYIPSFKVLCLILPILYFSFIAHPLLHIIFTLIILVTIEFFIGLNRKERNFIQTSMRSLINKVFLT